MKTGVEACKVAFPIFFIPFFFIYQPAIFIAISAVMILKNRKPSTVAA